MCGRYALSTPADRIIGHFLVREWFESDAGPKIQPRFNIAPTQPVLAVRPGRDGRRMNHLRWGLVPSWAKDLKIGNRMINARAETAAQKPAFRAAMKRRRCLIPASGFYEWQRLADGSKQPHLVTMADEDVFALAGLWEQWQDEHGNELETCAILTTEPNELMAKIHDRMPVIIDPADHDAWLDHRDEDATRVLPLLKAFPAELMLARPVSRHVNNVRNDDPRCIETA